MYTARRSLTNLRNLPRSRGIVAVHLSDAKLQSLQEHLEGMGLDEIVLLSMRGRIASRSGRDLLCSPRTLAQVAAFRRLGVNGPAPMFWELTIKASRARPASHDWLARHLLRQQNAPAAAVGNASTTELSLRESQVAQFIREGLSNKEIAQRMGIELSTVKTYVRRLFVHLGVHNRLQALTELGYLSPEDTPESAPSRVHRRSR
jgi:DNA-binding CsgD family transcriptional regulator